MSTMGNKFLSQNVLGEKGHNDNYSNTKPVLQKGKVNKSERERESVCVSE